MQRVDLIELDERQQHRNENQKRRDAVEEQPDYRQQYNNE